MKTKLSWVYSSFWGLLILTTFISWSGNPPDGRTGAPGDGFCTDCHSPGNPNGYDGSVTIQNFPSSITAGQTYNLTAVVGNPNGLATRAGFQAVVLDGSNNNAGDIVAPGNPSTTTTGNGREYVEHNPAINFPGTNMVTWNFDWTAPNGPNGETITIYAAGNVASGGSGNSEDLIVSSSASGTLMAAPDPLAVTITNTTDVDCNGAATGSATADATGGTPPYTYTWPTGTGATINGLTAGSYEVTVTDGATGVANATAVIMESSEIIPFVVSQTNIDCNNPTGTALISANGGAGGYSYSWPSGNMNSQEINLIAGLHVATVTDALGCIETVNVVITEDTTVPFVTAGPDQVLDCNNPSATLSGVGSEVGPNISYSWSTMGGNIVSATNAISITVDAPGIYTLTVINNDNGCFAQSSATVTEIPNTNIAGIGTDPSCFGSDDGSIQIAIIAGESPYIFDWDNDDYDGEQNPTGLVAGTYNVTVTDNIGCQDIAQVILTDPDDIVLTANFISPTCPDYCNGSIELIINGGVAPFTTAWSNGGDSIFIDELCADTYTALVTDANGCQDSLTISLFNPQVVQVTTTLVDETCKNSCDGSITIDATGGTLPYTYDWDVTPANTTDTYTGCAGLYTVTVTDAIGCFTVHTDEISGPDSLRLTYTTSEILCNGECTAAINVTVTGGIGMYTYSWSDASISDIANPTDLCAGTYMVTVTDDNACEVVETIIITEPAAIMASEVITHVSCNGDCDGAIDVTVTGGSGGFTFQWSNTTTDSSVSNLCAGNYTLTITDANNCSLEASYTITEPAVLTADVTATNETGNGNADGTATATPMGGTMPYSYLWSNSETTQTISGLSPGTYSVTVTDNNNCTVTGQAVVSPFNCDLAVTVTGNNESGADANDGSATATPTGGTMPYSYQWSNAGTTQTISDLSPGNYTVTVTDAGGCMVIESIDILAFDCTATVAVSTTDETAVGADDGTATATPAGGTMPFSYLWSNAGTTQTISGLSPGTYIVTITDANNCTATEQGIVAAFSCDLDVTVSTTAETATSADDGTATATPTGGNMPYSYLWSNAETTQTISGLSPATYSVTVTDDNGCTAESEGTVDAAGCSLILNISSVAVSCFSGDDGTATIMASGGQPPYSYAWSSGSDSITATDLSAGMVMVTVTDDNNCSDVASIMVQEPSQLMGQASATNTGCGASCDGVITLTVTGGTGAYSFDPPNLENLCPGTYAITITDENGCQTVVDAEVPNGADPIDLSVTTTPVTTIGGADGTASAIINGTGSGYLYVWSNNATTQTIDNLTAGEYCVTVTDVTTGCIATACAMVADPGCDLMLTTNATNVNCAGESTGTAFAVPSGGTAPITYAWSSSANTSDMETGLAVGTYSVTATDSLGCMAESVFEILEFPALEVDVTTTSETADGANDGSATANGSGGPDPNYTYLWNNGAITQTITGLEPATYCVTITDSNGCTAEGCNSVNPFGCDLTITLSQNNFTCVNTCDGSITVDVMGGTGVIAYDWVGPTIPDPDPVGLCPGTYMVTVTDEAGCTAEATTVINEYTSTEVEVNTTDASCNGACDATVELIVTGDGPFDFDWAIDSLDGSSTAMNLCAAEYALTITDPNNCMTPINFQIVEAGNISLVTEIIPACFDECNGQLSFSFSGGVPPYVFETDLPTNLTEICAGDYMMEITDSEGCILSETITIPENSEIMVVVDEIGDADPGLNNGFVNTTVTGGTPELTYSWVLNNTTVSTIEDPQGLAAGTYEFIVEDGIGCTYSEMVTVNQTVGTIGLFTNNSVSLFPNPASQFINLKFELETSLNVNISLYDLLGRMVYTENKTIGMDQMEQINTSTLITGMYTLVIHSGESMWSEKVIIQQR